MNKHPSLLTINKLLEQNAIFQEEVVILSQKMTALEADHLSLQTDYAALKTDYTALKTDYTNLQDSNSKLLGEIHELKDKLGVNSSNSSLPPSRDINKIKNKHRPKSGRNPGGQPGHKGYSYQPLPPDKIINVFPKKTCSCGHIVEVTDKYYSQQKVEIPPIHPYVEEYRCFHGICTHCLKKTAASIPKGIQRDLLGQNAKAIICALNGFFHNSKRDLQVILKDIFNLPISLGLVSNTAKRVHQQLSLPYQNIEEKLTKSSYLHIDETGHKSQGKKGWAWIFTNNSHTLLKLTLSRSKKVLEKVLGKAYRGYVISDRYSSYNYFLSSQRQICWSHLQRDFERLAQSSNATLSLYGHSLVALSREIFALNKALLSHKIKESYFIGRIKKLKKRLFYIFKHILKIKEVPKAHGLVKQLQKSFEQMWRFVENRSIAMTNNLAERQIRKYVLYRKKLLFTWSQWGNEYVERILSLFLTARLNKNNAFAQLKGYINSPS